MLSQITEDWKVCSISDLDEGFCLVLTCLEQVIHVILHCVYPKQSSVSFYNVLIYSRLSHRRGLRSNYLQLKFTTHPEMSHIYALRRDYYVVSRRLCSVNLSQRMWCKFHIYLPISISRWVMYSFYMWRTFLPYFDQKQVLGNHWCAITSTKCTLFFVKFSGLSLKYYGMTYHFPFDKSLWRYKCTSSLRYWKIWTQSYSHFIHYID